MKGATVCHAHGGKAPQVKQAARVRQAEERTQRWFDRADHAPVANPLEALQALAGEAVAWKDFCAAQVEQLERMRYEGEGTGEQIRGEIVVFERALDRCAKVLGLIARLNIDERLAVVSEQQVRTVTAAVTVALSELGLSEQEQVEAQSHVARQLRAVAG